MIAKFSRKDLLEALFADYYKEHRGFILVKSIRRGDPKMSTRYFPNIEILAKEHYGEERDVYFGVCPRERMKAEKEHIHYLVALWADLDIGAEGHGDKKTYYEGPQQAARAIRSFPRAPSLIVESGRGAHLYWLLKKVHEVTDVEKIESLLHDISEHLQCDTDCSLDTVLRLPETVNTKIAGKPVFCDVKFVNTNFRYDLEDFENLGPPIAIGGESEESAAPARGESVDAAIGNEGAYPEASEQGIDDSLVLDETIIDELIDDISMTGSVVSDPMTTSDTAPLPPDEDESDEVAAPDSDVYAEDDSEVMAEPESGVYPETDSVRAPTSTTVTPGVAAGSVLRKLSSMQTTVEISLVGSDHVINGTLKWNENGLIGVESGGDLYTIPLSSVSFIKSRTI